MDECVLLSMISVEKTFAKVQLFYELWNNYYLFMIRHMRGAK